MRRLGLRLQALFRRHSTAQKLVVVLVLALCPPVFSTYLLVRDNRALVEEQTLGDFQATAKIAAARTDAFLEKSEVALKTLAVRPDVQQNERVSSEVAFGQTYLLDPSQRNYFGIDQQHKVFASLFWDNGRPASVPVNYLTSLRGGAPDGGLAYGTNISDRLSFATPDIPLVAITTPIGSENNGWHGYLVGILSLGELQLALSNIEAQQHVSLIIVDGQGQILVHPDWEKVYLGESLSQLPLVHDVLHGVSGTDEYDGGDGYRWLAAYAPTTNVGWGVIVAQRADVLSSKVQGSLLRNAGYLSLSYLLACVIASLLFKEITRPLRELARHSIGVIGENETARVFARDNVSDEVHQVTRALDYLHANWTRSMNEQEQLKEETQRQAEQLSRLVHRLQHLQEHERRELVLEIHDGLAQSVYALNLGMRRMLCEVPADDISLRNQLDSVQEILAQVTDEVDVLLSEAWTPDFENGLETALAGYISTIRSRWGLEIDLVISSELPTVTQGRQLVVFQVIREALNNACKHSGGSKITVELSNVSGELQATVEDNGVGFDVPNSGHHLGLLGMRERADAVGAQLEVRSLVGHGTRVVLSVPLHSSSARSMGDAGGVEEQAIPDTTGTSKSATQSAG